MRVPKVLSYKEKYGLEGRGKQEKQHRTKVNFAIITFCGLFFTLDPNLRLIALL